MRVFSYQAHILIRELNARDIRLSREGDRLIVEGELDDDLRKRIRANKKGILELMEIGEHLWRPVTGEPEL